MRTIKFKLLLILGLVIIMNLSIGYYVMLKNSEINRILFQLPEKADGLLQKTSTINDIVDNIQSLNEASTQSIRSYVFTSDTTWKDKYISNISILSTNIENAISISNQNDKTILSKIGLVNTALIEMEAQSIILMDQGDTVGAKSILNSIEYNDQKSTNNIMINTLQKDKRQDDNNSIKNSLEYLTTINKQIIDMNNINGFLTGILITTVALVAIIIYVSVYIYIIKPISIIKKATTEITKGHLNHKIIINSKNEISDLAKSFNGMVSILRDSVENTESRIASRTKELQELNYFMTGRELKMIELKRQIKNLESKNEIKK